MKVNVFVVLIFLFIILTACKTTSKEIVASCNNVSSISDEAFVVKRKDLYCTDKKKLPYLRDEKNKLIPCQIDDIDNDGEWDELSFVYNLSPMRKHLLKIEWTDCNNYPVFPLRTNIRYAKLNKDKVLKEMRTDIYEKYNLYRVADSREPYPYQMDGPAWENDKVGFRLYFDGRNCKDISGKMVSDMVLDTVGISKNGLPEFNYSNLQEWGCDILTVEKSTGIGGLAIQMPDTLLRLGVNGDINVNIIDSTRYTIVSEGPVRSIFKLNYYGFQLNSESKIDLEETITIWAGKYGYEETIKVSGLPENAYLTTGVVTKNNDMPLNFKFYNNKYISMGLHDKQTSNKLWYLGMSMVIPTQNYVDNFNTPNLNSDICNSWCARLKPDENGLYKYNVYACWELSDTRFSERDFYFNFIDNYVCELLNEKIIVIR